MRNERKIKNWQILLCAFGLLVLSALAILVDVDLTKHRRSEFISGDFRRIIQLSEIFAHGFGIAITLYLVWRLAPRKRPWLPRLAACAILPGLACQFFKLFIVRYRPAFYFPEYVDQVAETWIGILPGGSLNFAYVTQSFPSAHAATGVGLAIGLVWLFPNCRNFFITLAFLASIQRVVAGAHWLSDVFAGAAVSVVVCGFIFRHKKINAVFAKFEDREATLNVVASEEDDVPAKAA